MQLTFIPLPHRNHTGYRKVFADAVVFDHTGQLLLLLRPAKWGNAGGKLTLFGGHVEAGETPDIAIIRELGEELGAAVKPEDIQPFGMIEERDDTGCDAVYLYAWRDSASSICIDASYEGHNVSFQDTRAALGDQRLMDYTRLALEQLSSI